MNKPTIMKKVSTCISLFVVMTFLLLPTGAFARTYDAIVAFGDSLSDNGNLNGLVGAPVPETWSDGDTWLTYLAAEWGATLDNNAYGGAMTWGHEGNNDNNTSDDAADAYGGVGVINIPNLGLIGQVNTYVNGSPSFTPSDTLFIIWIGANDFLELGKGSLKTPDLTPITDASTAVANAMTNIQTAITALYDAGAVNLLVMNLPDLGATPLNAPVGSQASTDASRLSVMFNSYLGFTMNNISAAMPGLNIRLFDTFTYLDTMIAADTFTNQTEAWMTFDGGGNPVFNGDVADYLFWDSIHPTTKAHEYVGLEVADVIEGSDDDDSSCFISSLQ